MAGNADNPRRRFFELKPHEYLTVSFLVVCLVVVGFMIFAGDRNNRLYAIEGGYGVPGELKQNLHSIQLALERYATDLDGVYPAYLYGGDELFNIGAINHYNPEPRAGADHWDRPVRLPYDPFTIESDNPDYSDYQWTNIADSDKNSPIAPNGERMHSLGDMLHFEGYMPKYPRNPMFRRTDLARRFGLKALKTGDCGFACYGGREGMTMFNLGIWGECVQLMFADNDSPEPTIDLPGGFYYHPRWKDGASNYGHLLVAQQDNPGSWLPGDVDPALKPPLDDKADVVSNVVCGYDLCVFGSILRKGDDLDVSLPGGKSPHMFRTGYLVDGGDRNPWVQAGDYEGCEDFDDRPYADGVPDFIILRLTSGY